MAPFKTFLIDPFAQTVTEVEYKGTLEHAYELIGCEIVEAVAIGGGDSLYCDEEGLINGSPQAFYTILQPMRGGIDQILTGRALVVGCNQDGDTVAPSIDFVNLSLRVCFRTRQEALEIAHRTGQ